MGKSFYLYKNKKGVFIAEILDPKTGVRVCYRTTGIKSRDEAVILVAGWLYNGIPERKRGRAPVYQKPKSQYLESVIGTKEILKCIEQNTDLDADGALQIAEALRKRGLLDFPVTKAGHGSICFINYLENFWNYDTSPYIREKRAHGQTIGKNHCYDLSNCIRNYYSGYFENKALNSITRQDLKNFSLSLSEKRVKPNGYKGNFTEKLAAATINKILIAGKTALKWAFREGIIPVDPTEGLMRFSGTPQKRGIFTPGEVETIFTETHWEDKRAYIANLLACVTGMRSGEILAIKKTDIDGNILHVRHSWSKFDGLKAPKNGERRRVPLLPVVKDKLLELAAESPHLSEGFIFYGLFPDKPMDQKILITSLKTACQKAGIDASARGIVFHSWRHTWVTLMADKLEIEKISRVSGHKTRAMAEHYANHILDEAIEKTAEIGNEVFQKILPIKQGNI